MKTKTRRIRGALWAVFHPSGAICLNSIRTTKRKAIGAYVHEICGVHGNWPWCKKHGASIGRIAVTAGKRRAK